MKAALVRDSLRVAVLLVVDVKIEVGHVLRSLVGQRDPRSVSKWHLEVTVHGTVLHGYGQRDPGLIFLPAMSARNIFVFESGPEEIADRNFHTRLGLAVPVHAQHQFAQMKWTGRVDGEPNMPDRACAFNLRERGGGFGFHFHPVRVAARTVCTRCAPGNRVVEIGQSSERPTLLPGRERRETHQNHNYPNRADAHRGSLLKIAVGTLSQAQNVMCHEDAARAEGHGFSLSALC